MDFSFSEAQDAVGGLAKKLLAGRLDGDAYRAAATSDDGFARPLWEELGAAGLLGVAIPERFGGGGHGFLELCSLLVEAGAAAAPLPLWPTVLLGALPIAEHGRESQRREILPGVVVGATLLSAALVEPSGNDLMSPATRATRSGGAWRLEGEKTLVPGAHVASRILVPATTDDGAVGVFLLDPRSPGVRVARQEATNGEVLGHVTIRGANVPEGDVLGDVTNGKRILQWLLPRALVGLCATELGVVDRALRMTASYTSTRHQFDRPIATFQAVSQRAADAFIDVEAIRLTTWRAAWLLSEGREATREVAIAKYWACEGGRRVVYAAQHLHAGLGFDLEYPLHRYYVASKQIELTLGGAPVHLGRLGEEIAGE